MFREFRLVRGLRVEVGEELRGWRWGEPPVAPPPLGVRLSVSEIVGGVCESRRDLYLRRVAKVRVEANGSLKFGGYIHEVFRRSLVRLRRLVEEGLRGWDLISAFKPEEVAAEAAAAVGHEADQRGVELARFLAVQVAARVDEVAARGSFDPYMLAARAVPLLAEYVIDGRPLGLTLVRADALFHNVVVEVKVGPEDDRHALALAGYALAVEADEEVPVDAGLLIYISFNGGVKVRARPVAIGEGLRRQFLEERDRLMEFLHSGADPGLSPRCDDRCVFYRYCHGGGS
ncbi:type I-A CRISPR-associated protein Cas4/Csa1 [Pyrobaculum neutrophilum]|uniref:CRISPR-associated protein, Csa1 family n=1 Tax=Pyrobaculum neutrophilum (strain DSM 2338 / JCM 9278 / NBRC 100436 / V24Sta) TaxID=444157 RepID=B1YCK8_PYRNV|nr:type I-A CRISPR-associated protein Cas4/Csa1 [Pyrobaculum neutrophilum]ACB39521.1 CRISPR-associated protein, Csa1 family [Pyrobaculum neutrophilum V24Sta]